jgi:Ca-activated chloride channel family protein
MVFTSPSYLFLILLTPLLVWWWVRQPRHALRHPAADLLRDLPIGRARIARWGGAALRGSSLVLLAIALAGPRWPDLRTRIDTEGIAVVMVVDVSGSMAERDFDWNGEVVTRLDAVKRAFRLFVAGGSTADSGAAPTTVGTFEGRSTDLIGLVAFASHPETACPLTLSHSVLLRILDGLQPRSVPGESETNVSDALALGLHRLQAAGPRRKVLVLLSDGEHNYARPNSEWTPRQSAQIAASLRVPIYTLDAGGAGPSRREGSADPAASPTVVREQAVQTLEDLAHITGGKHFSVRDTASLLRACQAIDRLERTHIQSFQYRRYHEGYPWFALGAFLLIGLALGLERTVWRCLP